MEMPCGLIALEKKWQVLHSDHKEHAEKWWHGFPLGSEQTGWTPVTHHKRKSWWHQQAHNYISAFQLAVSWNESNCKTPTALQVIGPPAALFIIELQNNIARTFRRDFFSHITKKLKFKIPIVWTLIWKVCCLLLWNCVIKLECCPCPVWLTIIWALPKIILYYRACVSHDGNCLLTHKTRGRKCVKLAEGLF